MIAGLFLWVYLHLAFGEKVAYSALLVHSNDVMGEIEPCGCRTNPAGGMARKANLLKSLSDASLLQIDAGDLLFQEITIAPLLKKQAEFQAKYLLRALDSLGHEVFVPGEKDFALGYSVFKGLISKTKIKVLAANLRNAERTSFESHAIFPKVGVDGKVIRIGVFGVVGEDLGWPKPLKATSPIEAAKKEVKFLKNHSDLIIAVTHQGFEKDKKLIQAVSGIDLLIGAHSQSFFQTPMKEGSTWILQSSFKNQYVGLIPLEKKIDPAQYKLTELNAVYDSQNGLKTPIDLLITEFKKEVADLNSAEDVTKKPIDARGTSAKYQTFPKCSECHVKQFDFWRKTPHFLALYSLVEKQQIKNKECLRCHTVGLGDPKGFENVNHLAEFKNWTTQEEEFLPMESLLKYLSRVREAQSTNTEIKIIGGSHTRPMHRTLSALVRSWGPVQCENCHQPGGNHPISGAVSKAVEKSLCLGCHTPDRAPKWYAQSGEPNWALIQEKKALVSCPAGELEDAED